MLECMAVCVSKRGCLRRGRATRCRECAVLCHTTRVRLPALQSCCPSSPQAAKVALPMRVKASAFLCNRLNSSPGQDACNRVHQQQCCDPWCRHWSIEISTRGAFVAWTNRFDRSLVTPRRRIVITRPEATTWCVSRKDSPFNLRSSIPSLPASLHSRATCLYLPSITNHRKPSSLFRILHRLRCAFGGDRAPSVSAHRQAVHSPTRRVADKSRPKPPSLLLPPPSPFPPR